MTGVRPFGGNFDTQSGWSATALTVGTAAAAGRSLIVSCTTAGSAVLQMADGSEMTLNFTVGVIELHISITEVVSVTGFVGAFYNIQ